MSGDGRWENETDDPIEALRIVRGFMVSLGQSHRAPLVDLAVARIELLEREVQSLRGMCGAIAARMRNASAEDMPKLIARLDKEYQPWPR